MSGHELGGFKKSHKFDYTTLRNTLQNEIFIQNLNTSLATLFSKIDKSTINNDVFNMLNVLVNTNPSFGKKGILGSVSITKLKQLKTEVEQEFSGSLNIIEETQNSVSTENNLHDAEVNSAANQDLIKKTLNKIKGLFRRIHRKENNIKIAQYHIKNGSAPKQLFIEMFPVPFLIHDITFVQNYDVMVKRWQKEALELAIESFKRQVEALRNNIENNKRVIENLVNDISQELDKVSSEAMKLVETSLNNALEKAERINIRSFSSRDKSPQGSTKDDEIFENSFSSDYQEENQVNSNEGQTTDPEDHHSNNRSRNRNNRIRTNRSRSNNSRARSNTMRSNNSRSNNSRSNNSRSNNSRSNNNRSNHFRSNNFQQANYNNDNGQYRSSNNVSHQRYHSNERPNRNSYQNSNRNNSRYRNYEENDFNPMQPRNNYQNRNNFNNNRDSNDSYNRNRNNYFHQGQRNVNRS